MPLSEAHPQLAPCQSTQASFSYSSSSWFGISFSHALSCGSYCSKSSADGQLWVLVRVSNSSELPPKHHRMVFVDRIVTVHRIPSQEVPEAEKQFHLGIVLQPDHVLSAFVDQRAISGATPLINSV